MGKLYGKLTEYAASDYYPYHMPGHKRNMKGRPFDAFYALDITEIEGFDNLHQAEGSLKELQERANRLYGAEETFFLINGSTAGILSAVSAAAERNGSILIARNCHKSVYHAAYLNHLKVHYLYPPVLDSYGISLGFTAGEIEEKLKEESGLQAVLLTSPSYEGMISEIEQIAHVVHKYQIPFIVDAAHGAHLGFADGFPENAIKGGADIVIHSLHKTLPSPTQTALLHVSGGLVDRERLRRFLGIYQSSSPSYPLMAGMELCLDIMEMEGGTLFGQMHNRWEKMMQSLTKCKSLKPLCKEEVLAAGMKDFDVGKLVISTEGTGITGWQLQQRLRKEYHLELEMATDKYVLAMFTIMDTEQGYKRLTEALLEIDKELAQEEELAGGKTIAKRHTDAAHEEALWETETVSGKKTGSIPQAKYLLYEAMDAKREWLPIEQCEGRAAADFINLYPPGIPLAAPGEVLNMKTISIIEKWQKNNLSVQGINEKNQIPVVAI